MANKKPDIEPRQLDFALTKFFGLKYPVYVDQRRYSSEYAGMLHNHDYPQIWYCMDGAYTHQVGETVYPCEKGFVTVIPAGVFHKFRIPEGGSAALMNISINFDALQDCPVEEVVNTLACLFLSAFAKELGYTHKRNVMLSPQSQTIFENCASWLALLRYTGSHTVSAAEINKQFERLFSLPELALPQECRPQAIKLAHSHLRPVIQALSYLNNHYSEKIRQDALLKILGICSTSFYKCFKRFTGYTSTQYLKRLRVKHVHLYLAFTNYPLTYISDMCGFYDTQHMSHAVRELRGRSPRKWRIYLNEWYDQNPQSKLGI